MVPATSSRISPVPPYSGYPNLCKPYQYRTITFYGPTFQLCSRSVYTHTSGPTTPHRYFGVVWAPPLSLATTHGITICFLFLRVLRCFTSPRSPPTPMYSVPGDTTSLVPGFPIRTSSDPRSVGSSPRHIAASHVLHRLPVPRHPPCALKHLQR